MVGKFSLLSSKEILWQQKFAHIQNCSMFIVTKEMMCRETFGRIWWIGRLLRVGVDRGQKTFEIFYYSISIGYFINTSTTWLTPYRNKFNFSLNHIDDIRINFSEKEFSGCLLTYQKLPRSKMGHSFHILSECNFSEVSNWAEIRDAYHTGVTSAWFLFITAKNA